MKEASSADTPYGRYITSEGWFVLNLEDALVGRNAEKGGASYPIEPMEHPFEHVGVHLRILWPGDPNTLTTPRRRPCAALRPWAARSARRRLCGARRRHTSVTGERSAPARRAPRFREELA
jgi:hypothetical protein